MFKRREKVQFDRWGRFRLPVGFLKNCIKEYGDEVFITTTYDRTLQIYPLVAWLVRVEKLLKEKKRDPLLGLFLMKANYNGQVARLDRFGRVQIPGLLRKRIKLEGVINVEEREGHLELKPA